MNAPRPTPEDANAVKAAVLKDVRLGRLPPSVRSFDALHEHVDPNEYLLLAPGFARRLAEAGDPGGLLCLPKSKRHLTPPRFASWLVQAAEAATPDGDNP